MARRRHPVRYLPRARVTDLLALPWLHPLLVREILENVNGLFNVAGALSFGAELPPEVRRRARAVLYGRNGLRRERRAGRRMVRLALRVCPERIRRAYACWRNVDL